MSAAPVIYTVSIWSTAFWRGAAERAVKTFAQAFLAVFGVGTSIEVTGHTLTAETWALAGLSGAAAAALSVIMSLASPAFTAGGNAAREVQPTAPAPEAVADTPVPVVEQVIPDWDGAHRATTPAEDLEAELATLAAKGGA